MTQTMDSNFKLPFPFQRKVVAIILVTKGNVKALFGAVNRCSAKVDTIRESLQFV